jgi:hypothetical protein
MRIRLIVALVLVAIAAAPVANGKITPKMNKRVAVPGERVTVDFTSDVEHYLAPFYVTLVPVTAAPTLRGRGDRRQTLVGRLGTKGERMLTSKLTFRVPALPAGRYALAVWFKGSATRRWHNLVEGRWRPSLVLQIRQG